MIPHNPALFVIVTVVLAVVPVLQAADPGVTLPPWALLAVAVVNVVCATLLKMMAVPISPPPGTEVDQLIDRLEALPKDDRDELSSRLEWRARLRGEVD